MKLLVGLALIGTWSIVEAATGPNAFVRNRTSVPVKVNIVAPEVAFVIERGEAVTIPVGILKKARSLEFETTRYLDDSAPVKKQKDEIVAVAEQTPDNDIEVNIKQGSKKTLGQLATEIVAKR